MNLLPDLKPKNPPTIIKDLLGAKKTVDFTYENLEESLSVIRSGEAY